MAAATAMMFATGCEGTNSIPAGKSRIVVKLNGVKAPATTRSVEAPADLSGGGEESAATLDNNAWVFVISEVGVHSEQLNISKAMNEGFTIGENEGTSLDFPHKLFPSDSEVYVLGNVPEDVDPESFTSWADIEQAVSAISYASGEENNVDFSKPAMANADGVPAALDPQDLHTATVEINLSPLYSRVELHKLTGGEHISSFTVAGVYINNYYQAFDMTGAGYADQELPQYIHEAGSDNFSKAWGDDNDGNGWNATSGVLGDNQMNTHAIATAGGSNVWAYNVGAGSVVTFIIELTDVEYYKEDGSGEFDNDPTSLSEAMYLNVTGYRDFSGNFQRGHIYRIEDLEFDFTDLTEDPVTGVSILANVSVDNWKVKALDPILGD